MDKMKVNYEAMLGLVAEMVLDEALLQFRKERICAAIDEALAVGDERTFHRLASELKTITAP
ncbi:IDEAL domain-containing protein [Paenibacillaceae bacterium]|nr:IDEAL domain-containing protein [Paenibacillaceae bacterium]